MPRRFKAGRIKQTRSRKQTATFAKSVMGDGTHIETLPTDRLLAQERENDPVFHSQRKLGGTIDDSIPFPPTVFYWPGQYTLAATTGTTPTFTRATSATFEDFEGLVRTADSGEPRFVGARRVENLITASEDMTNAAYSSSSGATVDSATQASFDGTNNESVYQDVTIADDGSGAGGRTFVFSCYVKLITGTITADAKVELDVQGDAIGATTNVAIGSAINSTTAQRFSITALTDAAGTNVQPVVIVDDAVTLEITNWQLEEVTGQTNQNPSEYVSTGVGTGAEELVNGGPFTDTTGWDHESGTELSVVASSIQGTKVSGGNGLRMWVEVPTVVGKTYAYSFHVGTPTTNVAPRVSMFDTNAGDPASSSLVVYDTSYTRTYVATATTSYLVGYVNTAAVGTKMTLSDISIKEASHGANIDGVQYFNTLNANTVTAGVVTEATGSAITSATTQFGDLNGGAGDYFSTPDSVANSLRQSMVIDVDLVLDEDSGGYRTIMCKGYSAPSRGWFIDESVGGQLRFYISGDGTAQVGITGTNSIPRGQRFNLKAVYDAVTTGISLLVNDVEIASNTSTGITSLYDNAGLVSVGCNPSASYDSIDGKIYSATVTKGPTPYPYVLLDGVSGTYVSTPDSAANSITGNMTIEIDADIDWTPNPAQMLFSKYGSPGNRGWYIYNFNSGTGLQLLYSDDGNANITVAPTVAISTVFPGKQRGMIRVSIDVDNGAGGNDVTFSTSVDSGVTWVQLGDVVTAVGTTSIFPSTADVAVGTYFPSGSPNESLTGIVYSAKLYNGVGASKVLVNNFYPQPYLQGDTNFTSVTGELWTLQGNAIATSPIDDGAKVDFNANDYVAGQTFESSGTNAELWTAHGNAKAFTPLSQAIDLDGSSDGWSTPSQHILGDAFFAGWGAPDDWTSDQFILGKYDVTPSNSRAYALGVTSNGYLTVITSSDGSATVQSDTTIAPGFTDGSLHGFGVSIDLSANTASFYTTSDSPWTPSNQVVWTLLQTVAHVQTGINSNNSFPTVGGLQNNLSTNNWTGRIMRAYAIASTDPTVQPAWDFDARALTPGVTTGTMPTGEVWTAVGNGTIEAQIPAPWDASGPFGYLAEGARTNIITASQDIIAHPSGYYITGANITITSGFTDPAGTSTAVRLTATGSGTAADNYIRRFSDTPTYTKGTFSVWVRRITGTGVISLQAPGGGYGYKDVESEISDAWTRVDINGTAAGGFLYWGIGVETSGDVIEVAFFQMEPEADFPSSYIPTDGSSVTRNADLLTAPAAGNADTFPMTVSADYILNNPAVSLYRLVTVSDGTNDNRINMLTDTSGGAQEPSLFVRSSAANVASITSSVAGVEGASSTITGVVAANDFELYQDGASVGRDAAGAVPSGMTVINIGSQYDDSGQPYGNIRSVKIFDERLTDAEVADL